MNLGLFKSIHGLVAVALVAAFVGWWLRGGFAIGRGPSSSVPYLLWSGWIALLLYVVLILYAARKWAHRLRISPEFKMKLPMAQLEQAQARLSDVRVKIMSGELSGRFGIGRAVRRILREEGVSRVMRLKLVKGPPGGPKLLLKILPRQPIGSVAHWMHSHIFYGMAAAALVWLHGGGDFWNASAMGLLLNGLSYLVILTGLIGIGFWVFGPTWLTRREQDLSTERAFALSEHYPRKVAEARERVMKSLGDGADSQRVLREAAELERMSGDEYVARAEGLLATGESHGAESKKAMRELIVLIGQRQNVEAEWQELKRIRFWLNAWRLVHVPASILLMVTVMIHVISVWWY